MATDLLVGVTETLDYLDKMASFPLFRTYLGPLEYPLSMAFTWHGCPLTALGLGPLVVASLALVAAAPDGGGLLGTSAEAALWLALTLGFFLLCARKWFRLLCDARGIQAMYDSANLMPIVFGATLVAQVLDLGFMTWLNALRLGFSAAEAATAMAEATAQRHGSIVSPVAFYLCCYLFTQVFVMAGKVFAQRTRPGASLAGQLRSIRRRIPMLHYLHMRGYSACESFPSGDAAGAAVFSTVLVLCAGWSPWAAYSFTALSGFGRIYLWAHHIGDVVVGAALGIFATHLLDGRWYGCQGGGWRNDYHFGHVLVAVPAFLLKYHSILKFRQPLPPALEPLSSPTSPVASPATNGSMPAGAAPSAMESRSEPAPPPSPPAAFAASVAATAEGVSADGAGRYAAESTGPEQSRYEKG